MKKALFLDRDGTINEEKNYVYKRADFVFRDGIFELVKGYFDSGYAIFVITNQSGIARGLYTETDFKKLTH
jgi:D-glycero-D-manno-heptose 1,7-bisphosphate phosphatase